MGDEQQKPATVEESLNKCLRYFFDYRESKIEDALLNGNLSARKYLTAKKIFDEIFQGEIVKNFQESTDKLLALAKEYKEKYGDDQESMNEEIQKEMINKSNEIKESIKTIDATEELIELVSILGAVFISSPLFLSIDKYVIPHLTNISMEFDKIQMKRAEEQKAKEEEELDKVNEEDVSVENTESK